MMWRCPLCRKPFVTRCGCGFAPRVEDGIVDMTTDAQRASYDPIVADYERRRAEGGWGGDDIDLPEAPIRHEDYWAFRQHSVRALERLVRKKATGGRALDVGAGNCWLTRYIDRWGFEATAFDINAGGQDGLRAGSNFLTQGDHFDRIRGLMTDMPFDDRSFELLVAANALHWSEDLPGTVTEFARVLKPGGTAVVLDSPWFERRMHGRRRIPDRIPELTGEFPLIPGTPPDPFLWRAALDAAARNKGMAFRCLPVFFGFQRIIDSVTARFYQRALARFPLVVLEKSPRE